MRNWRSKLIPINVQPVLNRSWSVLSLSIFLLLSVATDSIFADTRHHSILEQIPNHEPNCIDIKRITLIGDRAPQFQRFIQNAHHLPDGTSDPAIHRCLGAQGMNLVMRRIQNSIIARGFITTRIVAGPQTHFSDGILELTVFPGRIRRVLFTAGTNARATKWNAIPVRSGDLLNVRDLEQALENFKRLSTVESNIQIVPATGPDAEAGQSDLMIQWKQNVPLHVYFSMDDAGTKSAGRYQSSITVSYDHLFALNDLFYINAQHDLGGGDMKRTGTSGYTVHYSLPLGYWLCVATVNHNNYHQSVWGANQTYIYSGHNNNQTIGISRVMYRDAVRKTIVSVMGWARTSKNFIDDTEIEVQRRHMFGIDVGLSHQEYIGSALLDVHFNWHRGFYSLPIRGEFISDALHPTYTTADIQLKAPFHLGTHNMHYTGVWRAQWNQTRLELQDAFAIGGRYTVRGFDGENQLFSERGWLMRNDFSCSIGSTHQEFYLGIDCGQVGTFGGENRFDQHLIGAFFGIRGVLHNFSYDVLIGTPIRKPDTFPSSDCVTGFNLNWSF